MRSPAAAKARASKLESKSEPTNAEKLELLEQSILKGQKLAESDLEMAQVFLKRGKVEIARRRLSRIIDEFGGAEAAIEAKAMLKRLGRSSK